MAMHEHIAQTLYYLGVHLLFASMVWTAAWVLTSILRGSATTKYWIWLATSLNFILPLGAILDKIWAPHLSWARPLGAIGDVGARLSESATLVAVLGGSWLVGATLMLTRLCLRVRAERREARAAVSQSDPVSRRSILAGGVPVKFAGTRQAPAVGGLVNPYISLPHGIERLLTKPELNAVLLHELTHAKRLDNLARLIHEVGLCVLWFHPLVWITGSRLSLYRELSCDESVIENARGSDLVSALAKLANPEEPLLLQASASSFLSHRLARLSASPAQRSGLVANTALIVVFCIALFAGVFETVAHTACCFVHRGQAQVVHACRRT
jgi:beta-lactamase regulating signal transducer with metallopeptidase domain